MFVLKNTEHLAGGSLTDTYDNRNPQHNVDYSRILLTDGLQQRPQSNVYNQALPTSSRVPYNGLQRSKASSRGKRCKRPASNHPYTQYPISNENFQPHMVPGGWTSSRMNYQSGLHHVSGEAISHKNLQPSIGTRGPGMSTNFQSGLNIPYTSESSRAILQPTINTSQTLQNSQSSSGNRGPNMSTNFQNMPNIPYTSEPSGANLQSTINTSQILQSQPTMERSGPGMSANFQNVFNMPYTSGPFEANLQRTINTSQILQSQPSKGARGPSMSTNFQNTLNIPYTSEPSGANLQRTINTSQVLQSRPSVKTRGPGMSKNFQNVPNISHTSETSGASLQHNFNSSHTLQACSNLYNSCSHISNNNADNNVHLEINPYLSNGQSKNYSVGNLSHKPIQTRDSIKSKIKEKYFVDAENMEKTFIVYDKIMGDSPELEMNVNPTVEGGLNELYNEVDSWDKKVTDFIKNNVVELNDTQESEDLSTYVQRKFMAIFG